MWQAGDGAQQIGVQQARGFGGEEALVNLRSQTHSPGAPCPPQPSSKPPGAHSQAGTSSRKSAFCMRSRLRSCRTMWLFQPAAGAPVLQGPAMAALSRQPRGHPRP